MKHPDTRNTIYSERAKILEHTECPARQNVLRLYAPQTAQNARPGQFVHLQCSDEILMRRPMSIMRVNKTAGWIEILFKVHGDGTSRLASRATGDELELLGPVGIPFKLNQYKKHPLLIGGGVGIPPIIFLVEHIKDTSSDTNPLVMMGSEIPFPFTMQPSRILTDGIPHGVIASMPLLEDWGIPCRLASLQNFPGCFEGYVTDLARHWLDSLAIEILHDVEIFSCGPTPMLRAVSYLAQEYNLPCQISMEEYMACAVGGCAGCAIQVHTSNGPAMKRVCVDGPVFEAANVFPIQNIDTETAINNFN